MWRVYSSHSWNSSNLKIVPCSCWCRFQPWMKAQRWLMWPTITNITTVIVPSLCKTVQPGAKTHHAQYIYTENRPGRTLTRQIQAAETHSVREGWWTPTGGEVPSSASWTRQDSGKKSLQITKKRRKTTCDWLFTFGPDLNGRKRQLEFVNFPPSCGTLV